MNDFTNYLERMIDGCNLLKGMEREKAIYQSVLKEYRKQCSMPVVVESFYCYNQDVKSWDKCANQCELCKYIK